MCEQVQETAEGAHRSMTVSRHVKRRSIFAPSALDNAASAAAACAAGTDGFKRIAGRHAASKGPTVIESSVRTIKSPLSKHRFALAVVAGRSTSRPANRGMVD